MFAGYGVEAVARVVAERVAAGPQFLLPTEDGLAVALELAARFGLPSWQFTLSATQANTEAIRVARAITGRSAVLMFDGKYHGHADELLGEVEQGRVVPEGRGVPADATRHVRLVQYNDLAAVEHELAGGDVACVLAEAAVTNTGVIQPAEGFHAGLRALATQSGALLVLDETHTLVAGPGGLTARWALEPDVLVLNATEARARFDLELFNLQRLYMANRGIWEAIDSAGPACGMQTTEADVDAYLETLKAYLAELT